jgi:hypothetical protein
MLNTITISQYPVALCRSGLLLLLLLSLSLSSLLLWLYSPLLDLGRFFSFLILCTTPPLYAVLEPWICVIKFNIIEIYSSENYTSYGYPFEAQFTVCTARLNAQNLCILPVSCAFLSISWLFPYPALTGVCLWNGGTLRLLGVVW